MTEEEEEAGSTDAVTGFSDKEDRPALPGKTAWQKDSIVATVERLASM